MTAPKESKPKRERKPARTIEQQIADLKAKAEARVSKQMEQAQKVVADTEAKIAVAEAKLGDLYADLMEAQTILGIDTADAQAKVETYAPELQTTVGTPSDQYPTED